MKEQLPLPRKPPRKRILDDDDEVLNLQNNEDTDSGGLSDLSDDVDCHDHYDDNDYEELSNFWVHTGH